MTPEQRRMEEEALRLAIASQTPFPNQQSMNPQLEAERQRFAQASAGMSAVPAGLLQDRMQAPQREENFLRAFEQLNRIAPKTDPSGRQYAYGGEVQAQRSSNPFVRGLNALGAGIMDRLRDPAARARLAAGLQSMTVSPNQQFIQGQLQRASDIEGRRRQAKEANMTAQYLRTIGRDNLANLIEANPSMATEVLSQLFTAKDTFATKGFAPQIDPQTGQMFGVQYDPNTGEYTRVDIKDAIGETPAQILERETLTELERADLERAMQAGQDAFVAAERATGTIDTLTRALSALGEGAESGVVANLLPSFNRATTELRQAATEMGIDLIQSATFGALSKDELELALSSTIDLRLPGPELRELLENKIRVQQILRDELMKKARELSAGKVKYSDFIQRYEVEGGVEPAKVTVVRPEDL